MKILTVSQAAGRLMPHVKTHGRQEVVLTACDCAEQDAVAEVCIVC